MVVAEGEADMKVVRVLEGPWAGKTDAYMYAEVCVGCCVRWRHTAQRTSGAIYMSCDRYKREIRCRALCMETGSTAVESWMGGIWEHWLCLFNLV